jgi:phosphocarrier protein
MSSWVPELGAQALLLVDSELVEDQRRRTICELSAMGQLEVLFSSEERAKHAVAACRTSNVLVLFSSLASVERAMKAGLVVSRLNIGHLPAGPGRRELHPAVHLGPEDAAVVARIEALGAEVFVQPLPRDAATAIEPDGLAIVSAVHREPVRARTRSAMFAAAKFCVVNERGLHLRAAQTLAQLAGTLSAEVTVGHGTECVNAKSLLGLTTLAAGLGTWLEVSVEGNDAQKGLEAIRNLFATGFGEGVAMEPTEGNS